MDLDKDLHVNPARILDVCRFFRDRHEAPTRLADTIDEPMPVDTGSPQVDSDTTVAMQRLTARFDEFGEAMRRDAAGLVRSLQRYRATESAMLTELEEITRQLAARSGTAPPTLRRPGTDTGPVAVQPQATQRTRTWEAVEPPSGAECARRLGQPESIRALAQGLIRAGTGMEELIATMRRQLNDLVPDGWNGEGAAGFKDQIEQQLQTGSTGIVERSRKVGEAANKFADRLHGAWVTFAEAEVLAIRFNLTIRPNFRGDCNVYLNGPGSVQTGDAAERCMKLVEEAIREAAGAQAEFRMALTETYQDRLAIWRPVLVSSISVAALAAARAKARGRRTPSFLAQLEAQLNAAPRIKLGNVGAIPRHLLGPDGQPGTTAGNLMHQRVADFLQTQYPGVRFRIRVAEGETGVDMRVIGRAPGVRDPGFDYLEIKPNSPTGIRSFTQSQWGTADFRGRGGLVTYGTDGSVYRLDIPPF